MIDCVFCAILADRVGASFVHRDELVSAFLDIRPSRPVTCSSFRTSTW